MTEPVTLLAGLVKQLNDVLAAQAEPGNGRSDPENGYVAPEYMRGFLNGLILAESIVKDIEDPEYVTEQDNWPVTDKQWSNAIRVMENDINMLMTRAREKGINIATLVYPNGCLGFRITKEL